MHQESSLNGRDPPAQNVVIEGRAGAEGVVNRCALPLESARPRGDAVRVAPRGDQDAPRGDLDSLALNEEVGALGPDRVDPPRNEPLTETVLGHEFAGMTKKGLVPRPTKHARQVRHIGVLAAVQELVKAPWLNSEMMPNG